MQLEVKGKAYEVKTGTKVQLEDGKFATVLREYNNILIVKTDTGESLPVDPSKIIKVIEEVTQTITLLQSIFNALKPLFQKVKSWF